MSKRSVLVLAPHPDDETLGCGGTIALMTESGVAVDVLLMTRGERGCAVPSALDDSSRLALGRTRSAEVQEACRILGVRSVDFLDGTDGGLPQQQHLADPLRRRLAANDYERVFCPWMHEQHPDHAATFHILRQAVVGLDPNMLVWLYEVWTPIQRPNEWTPIDGTFDRKGDAIKAHRSQLAYLDYLAAFQGLAAYRAMFCMGTRHVEAFLTTTAGDLLKE